MYEKSRASLYAIAVALNVLALSFGWYSEAQGAAILGVANAVIGALAFVNVPAVRKVMRPDAVDES